MASLRKSHTPAVLLALPAGWTLSGSELEIIEQLGFDLTRVEAMHLAEWKKRQPYGLHADV